MEARALDSALYYGGQHELLDSVGLTVLTKLEFEDLIHEQFDHGSIHPQEAQVWGPTDAINFGVAYPFKRFASWKLMHNGNGR